MPGETSTEALVQLVSGLTREVERNTSTLSEFDRRDRDSKAELWRTVNRIDVAVGRIETEIAAFKRDEEHNRCVTWGEFKAYGLFGALVLSVLGTILAALINKALS